MTWPECVFVLWYFLTLHCLTSTQVVLPKADFCLLENTHKIGKHLNFKTEISPDTMSCKVSINCKVNKSGTLHTSLLPAPVWFIADVSPLHLPPKLPLQFLSQIKTACNVLRLSTGIKSQDKAPHMPSVVYIAFIPSFLCLYISDGQ